MTTKNVSFIPLEDIKSLEGNRFGYFRINYEENKLIKLDQFGEHNDLMRDLRLSGRLRLKSRSSRL